MIRDPHFWKRFSIAVHQDDLEKEIMTAHDTKNPYVTGSSLSSPAHSPLESPISQTHLSLSSSSWSLPAIGFPTMVQLASLRSSCIDSSPLSASDLAVSDAGNEKQKKKKRQRTQSNPPRTSSSAKPLLSPGIPDSTAQPWPFCASQALPSSTSPTSPPHHQQQQQQHTPSRPFFRAPNLSTLSLSLPPLSGRPIPRFKFITTITADAPHRDSWLARQQKKQRHRTWICCAFCSLFLFLIAGVVTTVLVLKAHGIL